MVDHTTTLVTCPEYNAKQAKIKVSCKYVEYIPCAGHSSNLVGVSAAESCSSAIDFFGIVQQLNNYFSTFIYRWTIVKKHLGRDLKVPKSLSQTRWSARADACVALKEGYKKILSALDELFKDKLQPSLSRNEEHGLQLKPQSLEVTLMVVIWSRIMERFDEANKILQKVDTDIGWVTGIYSSLVSFI